MTLPPFENSDHVVVSVSIEFPTNWNLDVPFHWIAHDYSHADWDCLVIIREMFHVRISINSVLLLLLMNFVNGFRLELMYTSLIVSVRSKPLISWFSSACAVAIAHRNHFFRLYKEKRSPESKVKFRQASNCSKRVLEAAKHAYTTKTKESITSQKLGSRGFCELVIVFSTKVNLPYLLYSMDRRCYLMHLIKQNYLLTFPRTLILMNLVSLYQFSLLELIWNCITFP